MTNRPDLGSFLDEIHPRLFERLDSAFPEFGWERHGSSWVATVWPSDFPDPANEKKPDRLIVYADHPVWIKVHGHTVVRFLDLVNGGRKPRGKEFPEAVRRLAELAGVALPETKRTPEEVERARSLELRREALEAAVDVCRGVLVGEHGAAARAYLETRGIDDAAAEELGVGLYPSADEVHAALVAQGVEASVARSSCAAWERMEGYATFPWWDAAGRVLTIYGRWPGTPPEGRPKTMALPGADTKGVPLYFDRAIRGAGAGRRELVLVEGVLDAAVLQARGERNVVACVSAQLSSGQADALVRHRIDSVTVCLDPDGGGDRGTRACVDALHAKGARALVAPRLPDGQDPDELVLAHGIEAWRAHVGRAVSGWQWLATQELGRASPATPIAQRTAAAEKAVEVLGACVSEIERELVLVWISERVALPIALLRSVLRRAVDAAEKRAKPRGLADGGEAAATSGSGPAAAPEAFAETYAETAQGLVWNRRTPQGFAPTLLTNFSARIVAEVVEDDGAETKTFLEIQGKAGARAATLRVLSVDFPAMRWPVEHLGPAAVVHAGRGVADHARAAIQLLSGHPERRRLFTHLGWRKLEDGAFVYLHAAGAVGGGGPRADAIVRLEGPLEPFALPEPVEGEALKRAILTSLQVVRVAPGEITWPILCAVYRAVLGRCDFALHLAGPSGAFKSELAALAQRHFGAGLDARHLPGSWSSTENALEGLAFSAKDALLVVDDFAPKGSLADVQRLHAKADRLFRAQGNGSARGRLNRDLALRAGRPPRGLILSTGEDVPDGHSIRARALVVEVGPGGVDAKRLTAAQAAAAEGLYAQALASYLCWLAPRIDEVQRGLSREAAEVRDVLATDGGHRRTPAVLADLAVGLRWFLTFAVEVGALTTQERDGLWNEAFASLQASVDRQGAAQAEVEPTTAFLRGLASAIASGRAHLADTAGHEPEGHEARWGWRAEDVVVGMGEIVRWRPQGSRVGWVDGEEVFLDPQASYDAARQAGAGLAITPETLGRRLKERGLLVSSEGRHATVKRQLSGGRRRALHLQASSLVEKVSNAVGSRPTEGDKADQAQEEDY